MGVFKNGVGRPSNETIKKRRIVYVLSALAVVAAIASTTYMLNSSFSSKKISGSVRNTGKGVSYEIIESKNVKQSADRSWNYIYSKDGLNIRISNSNNYGVYYKFEYINFEETGTSYEEEYRKTFKEGFVKAKSSEVVNVKNLQNSNVNSFSIYKTKNDLNNNANVITEDRFFINVTKSGVLFIPYGGIGDTPDPLYHLTPTVTRESYNYFGAAPYFLKNISENNYYYRTFLYKDTKVNGAKLSRKSSCKLIKANSNNEISDIKSMNLNEKNSKLTYQVKVYKNKNACNIDALGTSKRNVVETVYKDSSTYVEKDKFYVQLINSKAHENKLRLYVASPENFKKYQLEVYGKKKGSAKYSEVLNETYDYDMFFEKIYLALPDITLEKKNMSSYRVYIRLLDENGNSDESISINNWKPEGYKIVNKDGNKWATRTYNVK